MTHIFRLTNRSGLGNAKCDAPRFDAREVDASRVDAPRLVARSFDGRKFRSLCLSLFLWATLVPIGAHAAEGEPIRLVVLDLELVGDLGDPSLAAEHAARLAKTSDQLRAELSRVPRYEVVDLTPASEMIEASRATQYLYKCNGCEIDIAKRLDGDQVLVAWIHRVSQLILTLTYEIRDVPSATPVRRKAFDFRGDNDAGWSRAVTSMVNDLADQ